MITSELYGAYEVRPQDYDDMSVTALQLNAAVGVLKTLTQRWAASPLYAGFQPILPFTYHTFTTMGILSLYRYPLGSPTEVPYTGGSGVTPNVGDIATGATSGASGPVACVNGTWGTGGILYLQSSTGLFTAGETINFSSGGSCVAGSGILLASWNLTNGAAPHNQYMQRIVNTPPIGTFRGHALPPIANLKPQDQLVWKIDTQAVGDSYITGTFQLALFMQYRGESYALEPAWNDVTPVQPGISSAE